MNFELTDDQRSIKRTARELLASRYRLETVRELAADERGFTDEQWQELSQLGWPGVVVPEDDGGLGLGAVELVVIEEEIGYALAPTRCSRRRRCVAAGRCGHSRTADRLAAAAGGRRREGPLRSGRSARAGPDGSELEPVDGRMSGRKIAVPDAASAQLMIVAGADGRHFLVETDDPGVGHHALNASLDPTRKLYTVDLTGAAAEELRAPGSRPDQPRPTPRS